MNHWKQSDCKRSTYYTMITLFNQTRKYSNQNNKILHFVHMALQAAPVNGTTIVIRNGKFISVSCDCGTTEPSISVPGSSDRHAQLLAEGNFEIIWNLDKILVRVMGYKICDRT